MGAENVIGIRLSADAQDLQRALNQGSGYIEGFARNASANLRAVGAEAGRLQSAVSATGSSFAALAGSFAAGLGAFTFANKIKDTIDMADSFNKLSQKTGVAVAELSKLNYAAGLSDVSTESLQKGLRKLNLSISEAAAGSQEKIAVFNALSVSFKDASGNARQADAVFKDLSEALSQSADGADKIAVGSNLMGKGFEDLVPMVNAGKKGLADMGDEAQKLGIVLGSDFAKNAEEFNDNLRKLKLSGDGLFITLGGDLVKGLGDAAKEMANAAIEGGKLAGVIAGIQTLLTGTDQYKNDKALVEQTELKIQLENSLLVARRNGNAAYIKSREDALAAVNAEIKVTQTYRTLLQSLQADKARSEADKPTAVSNAVKNAARASGSGAGSGTKGPSEYQRITDELKKQLDLANAELDVNRKLTEAEKYRIESLDKITDAYVNGKLSAEQWVEASAKAAQVSNAKNLLEDTQRQTKANLDATEAHNKYVRSLNEGFDKLLQETAAQEDHIAKLGLSKTAVADLDAAKLESQATLQDLIVLKKIEQGIDEDQYDIYVKSAAELRKQATLRRTGAQREQQIEDAQAVAKAAADEWQRGWEATDQLGREVFASWTDDGSNAAKKIGDTLKKALLSAIYEATIRPIAFQLYTSIAGGAPGGTGGTSDPLSTAAGVANGVSQASSALNWATNFEGAASKAFSKVGDSLIVNSVGDSAMYKTGAALSKNAGDLAYATKILGNTLNYLSAFDAAQKGEWGKAIGTAVGTYFGGPIMGQIAGAIGSAVDRAFGGGQESLLKTYTKGTLGSDGFTGGNFKDVRNSGNWFNSAHEKTVDLGKDPALNTALSSAFGVVKEQTAAFAKALGLNADSIAGFTKDITLEFTADKAANQKLIADTFTGIANDLASNFVSVMQGQVRPAETTADALARLATSLTAANDSLSILHQTLFSVGIAGADSASKLIDSFGGLQNFTATLASYYASYYSAQEQNAQTIANITKTLNASGASLTDADVAGATRETFRALVEGQDLNTDAGRKTYSALMSVQGAFFGVTQAAEANAKALVGFDGAGLGKMMLDAAFNPQAGLTAAQSFGNALQTSIQNTLLSSVVGQISQSIYNSIIVPIVAGAAVSAATTDAIISDAKAKLAVLKDVFASDAFTSALAQIGTTVAGFLPNISSFAATAQLVAPVAQQAADTSFADAEKDRAQRILDERIGIQDQISALTDTASEALDRQRNALDDSNRALFDELQILIKVTDARKITNGLLETSASLGIELMRAQGNAAGALAAERTIAIKGYNDEQIAIYDANSAVRTMVTELGRLKDVAKAIEAELPGVIAKYQTPEQRTQTSYQGIAQGLIGAGLTGMDLDALTNGLIGASKASIATVVMTLFNTLPESAADARLALIRAAGGLADLKDAADAAANAVTQQRLGLESTLLQLQGNTAELRKRELAALDPTNRALQEQIYLLQDAKTAQESYNTALSTAQSKFDSASSALKAAQDTAKGVQDQATGAYVSAQDKVASAQQRIADLQLSALKKTEQAAFDAAQNLQNLSKTLTEFVNGKTLTADQTFANTLKKALAGDTEAMQGLSGAATAASELAAARSANVALAQARIMADVMRVAAMAGSAILPGLTAEADPMVEAATALASAQTGMAEALRVVQAIGASTTASVTDLIAQYGVAVQAMATAQTEYNAAQQVLKDIKANTGATATSSGASLVTLGTVADNTGGTKTATEATARSTATFATGANATVAFAAGDPIFSVFNNISRTNELLIDGLQLQLAQLTGTTYSEALTPNGPNNSAFTGTYALQAQAGNLLSSINTESYNTNTYLATNNAYTIGMYSLLQQSNQILQGIATESYNTNSILLSGALVRFARGTSAGQNVYASGAAFTNGIVSRPTSFNESLMGEAGPEAIMPLTNINGSLGVRFAGNTATDALVSEIRRLRESNERLERRLANIEAAANSSATSNALTADSTRRMDKNGVLVYTDPAEPLKTQVAP